MRTISLTTPTDDRRYQLLWYALYLSPLGLAKGEHVAHAKLCEKMATLGQPDPQTVGQPDILPRYTLAGGTITVEDFQWQLLRRHLDASAEHIHKGHSGAYAATVEWLDGLPEAPDPDRRVPPGAR